MNKILVGLIFLSIFGCQTPGYYIMDQPHPASDLRKVINAVIGKPRAVSQNGRELYSEYHDDQFSTDLEKSRKLNPIMRYYTAVYILGQRRPYEINVQVIAEQYEPETSVFVKMGNAEELSQKRALAIKKALNLSPANTTGFDAEKPF
jgi:hypothetical protein